MIDPVLQTLMGALGSLGFALVFRVRGKLLIFAFLGGLLSWGTYCIAGNFVGHEALQYLVATTVLTFIPKFSPGYCGVHPPFCWSPVGSR